jgi:5-methyltetrahydropteroyltriglutamate--homocysteine methyltransferase
LPQLAAACCQQISIETAQSALDCSILEQLPSQTILLGVIDLSTHEVETPEIIIERVERALPHIDASRVVLAPDCGMKYLPRDIAFAKLKAMTRGAELLRRNSV